MDLRPHLVSNVCSSQHPATRLRHEGKRQEHFVSRKVSCKTLLTVKKLISSFASSFLLILLGVIQIVSDSCSLGHRAAVVKMPLQVALLHESSVAMLAVERLLPTVCADVSSDAEHLSVGSSAL